MTVNFFDFDTLRAEVSFAWLLAFTKSFAWLVCRVVGLLETGRKQTSYATDEHANDFLNAKSDAREKPLLAGYDFEGWW